MMSRDQICTAVMVGSTQEGCFGDTVAPWLVRLVALHSDIQVDLIDLAEAKLPAVHAEIPAPEMQDVVLRFANADAFVIITPEYNIGCQ